MTLFGIRKVKLWRRLAVAFLILLTVWLVAVVAAQWLIVHRPLERADVLVVLSGSSTFVERNQLAAELYANSRAGRIVLTNDNQPSGWSSSLQRNPLYYERAMWELQRLGVPADNIDLISTPVESTHDEALVVRDYSQSHNVHSILIVTSGYHSRRALWVFQKVFAGENVNIGIEPVTSDKRTHSPLIWWISVEGWRSVPIEHLKQIYYWIRF